MEYRHFLTESTAERVTFIPVRFGVGYDPVPAVGGADDIFTVNAGTGLKKGNWRLDVGYEFRFGNSVYAFDVLGPATAVQTDIRQHRVMVSTAYQF